MTMDDLEGLGNRVFVTDFDGTMTAVDFFDVVLNHADQTAMPDYWDQCVAGRLTHVEALNGIFQHAPRDLGVLRMYLAETMLDPNTATAIDGLKEKGWDVVVVSAGSAWYIEQLLSGVRDRVRILANPGNFTPSGGLTMTWPPAESLWYSRHFGVDKAAVVQRLQDGGTTVAFAGDGRPDVAAARLVPPDLRFARGWLAETLEREGLPFRRFALWAEIAEWLSVEG